LRANLAHESMSAAMEKDPDGQYFVLNPESVIADDPEVVDAPYCIDTASIGRLPRSRREVNHD